jgi:FkbM family methyltransferase
MKISVRAEDDQLIEFECADSFASRWTCAAILRGETYPFLPFVEDVRVVFDVGANCGAAAVHFARHYPRAQVHAFEPGSVARGYLEVNVAGHANVHVHPIGLYSADRPAVLFSGVDDIGQSSVFKRSSNLQEEEPIELRAAGPWAKERGIDRIDVLKVDVEGCEIDVLRSLGDLLPTVKLLYVEYDSRHARRELNRILDETHDLYAGKMFLDQGECVYLRRDVAALDAATERLRHQLERALTQRSG